MMYYYNKLGRAFGRKPRMSGMNRITRFQIAVFLEVLQENTDSWGWGWGADIQPLDLKVAMMEGGAETYFTQKARTIPPF